MSESQPSALSVNKYIADDTLNSSWESGKWKDCPVAAHYVQWHRYTGEGAVRLLEQMGLIPATKESTTILDAGCGTGLITSLIYENEGDGEVSVISLDKDEGMMVDVKRKRGLGEWQNWKGITADFYDNGLADDSLDGIIAHYFFFYLARDYPRAFTECRRLLKPGGLLGWTAPSYAYPLEDISKSIKPVSSSHPDDAAALATFPPAMPDVVCNTVEGSKKLMQENGFNPIFVEEISVMNDIEETRSAIGHGQ